MSRYEVTAAYKFEFQPSMEYISFGTTFSVRECNTMDHSYHDITLPHGLQHKHEAHHHPFWTCLSRVLWFHVYVATMSEASINSPFFLHLRLNREIGTHIQILLERFHLVIGQEEDLFTYRYSHQPDRLVLFGT